MRTILLSLAAVAIGFGTVRADEAADAAVKKAIDAHGGADTLKKMKAGSSKMKGSMTVQGLDLEFTGEVVYEVPGKYKMSINAELMGQKLSVGQVTNGKAYKNTLNGQPLKISDAEKAELAQAAQLQEVSQLVPLLGSTKYTIKAEKDVDVGGMACSVVLVTAKDFKDTRLFFDKKTNLLIKTEHKGLAPGMGAAVEVTEESLMTDYKKVDGVMLPMKILVNHDGKKFMAVTVLEAKMMETVDAKNFAVDE